MPDRRPLARSVSSWSTVARGGSVLAIATFLLYANSMSAYFVGDDFDFLRLVGRADGWLEAVGMTFWGEWEPVWYVSWYRDLRMWGFWPPGFHLTNTAWLALGVVALFGFLRTVLPERPAVAWTAAGLFLAHPLHDEAVVYLAARGHVMAVTLSLCSLWVYARARTGDGGKAGRWLALGGALALALLAALAKEVAVTLPAWIAMVEWIVLRLERPAGRRLSSAIGAGALFLIPAGGSLLLRALAVGLGSEKLHGALGDLGGLFGEVLRQVPCYALIGGLPLPFAFAHFDAVVAATALGWVVLGAAVIASGFAIALCARGGSRASVELGLFGTGLVVAAVALGPVLWADLGFRRRYLFMPSVGIALMAAVALCALARRWPRAGRGLIAALLLVGTAGTLTRHDLYVRAGQVTRELIVAVRGAPLGEPSRRSGVERPSITLLALPRAYGGDFYSGAYVLHRTDLSSALTLAGTPQRPARYASEVFHADDYTARVVEDDGDALVLELTFATRRAFEWHRDRDPRKDAEGGGAYATRVAVDPERRTVTHRVVFPEGYRRDPANEVYLYSDGSWVQVSPSNIGGDVGM